MSSDKFLRELVKDHPELPRAAADAMRARLAEHAALDRIQAVHLAHARARESVVTGVRMALRCGALLLDAGGDWDGLLRATGISQEAAAGYVALALTYPEPAGAASKRFGRLAEGEALAALQRGPVAAPVDDLRALRGLLA